MDKAVENFLKKIVKKVGIYQVFFYDFGFFQGFLMQKKFSKNEMLTSALPYTPPPPLVSKSKHLAYPPPPPFVLT